MRISDWSSDVCSSDLQLSQYHQLRRLPEQPRPVDRTAPGVRYRQLGPQQIAFSLGVMPDIIAPRGCDGVRAGQRMRVAANRKQPLQDRKSTRLKLQSLMRISYDVFCLKKKKPNQNHNTT